MVTEGQVLVEALAHHFTGSDFLDWLFLPGRCSMCRRPYFCIVPPHVLEKLLENKDRRVREAAMNTLMTSTQIRAQRNIVSLLPNTAQGGNGKRRTIYDAKNQEPDPPRGARIRGEGDKPAKDSAVNEAYDGLGTTYDFYKEHLQPPPTRSTAPACVSTPSFTTGADFNNAFWNGQEMVLRGRRRRNLRTGFTTSSTSSRTS